MNKNFDLFMSQLQETNQTLDFFCDFAKISENVSEVEMSLKTISSARMICLMQYKKYGNVIQRLLKF